MDGTSGWTFVAENEGAAALLGAIVDLDEGPTYTRSELCSAADVTMKELYLSDALPGLVEMGVLDTVETDGEATYTIDTDNAVYEAAVRFERAATQVEQ